MSFMGVYTPSLPRWPAGTDISGGKYRSVTQKQSGLPTLFWKGEREEEEASCPWHLHQGPGHPGGCSVLKTVETPQEISLKMQTPKGYTDLSRKRTVQGDAEVTLPK